MDIAAFIQQHGGYSKLAKKLSTDTQMVDKQTVYGWQVRGSIPPARILQMLNANLINIQEAKELYDYSNSKSLA